MKLKHILLLLTLSALWGSSFIFMRIAVPEIGILPVAFLRVGLGALLLLAYLQIIRKKLDWNKNFKHYFIVGLSNLAIPLSLFSFAAKHIPSAYSSILNATVPFWTTLLAWGIYGEKITTRSFAGILLGISGVAWISQAGTIVMGQNQILAFGGCLFATLCYGFSVNYIKRFAPHVSPILLTTGGLCVAGTVLLPLGMIDFPQHLPSTLGMISILCLAAFCTVIAFLIFYYLAQEIGSTKAVLVTFLVPIFAGVWGMIFLHEELKPSMFIGAAMIFTGLRIVIMKKNTA